MPSSRRSQTTPDLFPARPSPKASGSETIPVAENPAQQPHYLLPKDLAGALERLDDTEVDTLLAAVTSEAEHRGRLPRGSPLNTSASSTKRAPADDGARSLTKGKLNAVRAAFKAGVKPSAIARQFGISQSDVRKALATDEWDRKSWG